MKIELDVNFCSECLLCRLSETYYDPDTDDEGQDLYCGRLDKRIYRHLCWNEIATRHRCMDGKVDGLDLIPVDCPFRKNEIGN